MTEQQGQEWPEIIRAALLGAESDLSYILHRGNLPAWQNPPAFVFGKLDASLRLTQINEAQHVLTAALTNHDRLVQALENIVFAGTLREAQEMAEAALDALKEKP